MNRTEKDFVETVWKYYKENGRHTLPWRKTRDPYKILVSEVMLQQTQVDRVIPKYKSFVKKWGSVRALARAPLSAVLKEWQGLGYNRRAKMLHNCAKEITGEHKGVFPTCTPMLLCLPGVGPYTAGALMAFAYNKPVPIIETNIRTVYLHHFFHYKSGVDEKEILQSIGVTIDTKNPREWYWALMDYGAHLKKENGNPNRQSKHYTKQSKFEGSNRQIRGAIVRQLTKGAYTKEQLHKSLKVCNDDQFSTQLSRLQVDGLISKTNQRYSLPI